MSKNPSPKPRAMLVVVRRKKEGGGDVEEIGELARAADLDGLALRVVRLREPNAATYIGGGTVDSLARTMETLGAQAAIFNCPLSLSQQRNLSRRWGVRVIDRNELILDIFARRAKTFEGKLQVEMAQCEHALSRLSGLWTHLERQPGGIGLRGGPGEKQIEMDRRLLSDKRLRLRRQIKKMESRKQLARTRRRGVLTAVLAGYTNVGKSSLFNRLTRANASTKNRLFDTLESTARRAYLGGDSHIVLSDTVGFIRDLPHALVAGFRATLQDAATGDCLLLVADAAAADCAAQLAVVHSTLSDIGAADTPKIIVMNKIDKINATARIDDDGCDRIPRVWLSSKTGEGISLLQQLLHTHQLQLTS